MKPAVRAPLVAPFAFAIVLAGLCLLEGQAGGDAAGIRSLSGYKVVPIPGCFRATALNENGDVAGESLGGVVYIEMKRATIWEPGGGVLYRDDDQQQFDTYNSTLYDLNDSGDAVGQWWVLRSFDQGYFGIFSFSSLPEDLTSRITPSRINNLGEIVGVSAGTAALLADRNKDGAREITDLGSLGSPTSMAREINDHGQVVGVARNASFFERAFLWEDRNKNGTSDPGDMIDLGDLGGSSSGAVDINNVGQVVGWGVTAAKQTHAFFWQDRNRNGRSDAGEMIDLGTLGGADSMALYLNDLAQVVGMAEAADGNEHPFIWQDLNGNGLSDPGEMQDLARLASSDQALGEPVGINNQGLIAMSGGFRLIPTEVRADLSLKGTQAPASVELGAPVVYTFTVTNNGPDASPDVSLTDTVLPRAAFVSASTTQGAWSGDHFAFGTIAPGGTVTAKLTVAITNSPPGSAVLTSTATVDGPVQDSNRSNNSVTLNTPITLPQADLALSLSAPAEPVGSDQKLTYTLTVTNRGPGDALNVELEDDYPEFASLDSVTLSLGSSFDGFGYLICDLGKIPAGKSATVRLVLIPGANGINHNSAELRGDFQDPNPADNTVAADTTVRALIGLAVSLSATPDSLHVGEKLTYTVRVENNGNLGVRNVKMTDTLPAGVTVVTYRSAHGELALSGNTLTWTFFFLGAGEAEELTIAVIPTASGTLTNKAAVAGDGTETVPANNQASLTTQVTDSPAPPDLTASWAKLKRTRLGRGKSARWKVSGTLAVRNDGPAAAPASLIQYFLSPDTTHHRDDPAVGQRSLGALGAGKTLKVPYQFTFTRGTAASAIKGRRVIAVLDAKNAVQEADEKNNEVSSPSVP
jgi:uncharacterized repeat protein (TIGR01451 family)